MNAIAKVVVARCRGVKIIMDPGAFDHVVPKDVVSDAQMMEGRSFGAKYVGADGGTFPNLVKSNSA